MNRATYDALLKSLQKLEKVIAKAGVSAVRGTPSLHRRVEALHLVSETGGSLDDFVALLAGRSAVQLLLRIVYVRVLEDLGLLDPPRIRGERGFDAFRAVTPALGVRAYLKWTFRDLAADFPALFTPLDEELPLPPEDLCKKVWELWHDKDGKGNLLYDWSGGDFESRFLGDLYQDLDADVRERYALLQTPDFVEEYILDQTLTSALVEFDPARIQEKGDAFRVLDPTCGSGHFLIGAFRRLFDYWRGRGVDAWGAAGRALEGVWGCDINPYAVDVARFRLLLEVMAKTGVRDLEKLGGLVFNLRAMDSLIPWEGARGQGAQGNLFEAHERLERYATAEERVENARFLKRTFHVVVGNPPYVTPKDPQKGDDYRLFWPSSAYGKYGLAAPFCERFFALGTFGAYVGQITANAFAKREFGVSLVEQVLSRLDLTDIVDTSGAYIPGHGTPTVIVVGRSRPPGASRIRCIGGKRGEREIPNNPAHGKVWQAIAAAGREANDASPYITVSYYGRELFATHPWNVSGGGAPELQRLLSRPETRTLDTWIVDSGFGGIAGQDDVMVIDLSDVRRNAIEPSATVPVHVGEEVRDYHVEARRPRMLFSYNIGPSGLPQQTNDFVRLNRYAWRWRQHLLRRPIKGFKRIFHSPQCPYRLSFFYPERFASDYVLTFAEVATHNHFVLQRGGKIFKQTAPLIRLSKDATRERHLILLGILNSSTIDFWAKQVFFNKGYSAAGGGGRMTAEPWEDFYQRDSSKLSKAPVADRDHDLRVRLAEALHVTAAERASCLPAAVLTFGTWAPEQLFDTLSRARLRYDAHTGNMVALQEELDWLTYGSYGLLQGHETFTPETVEPLTPGHRPFEILLARHNASRDPEERTEWFARHGHAETTTIPEHYSQATRDKITERLQIIATNKDVRLIEQPQFKRRWQLADFDAETKEATRDWLLDRLEDLFAAAEGDRPAGPLAAPQPQRLEEILAALTTGDQGARVLAVARIHAGSGDVDLPSLVESLLRDHAIPDNPFRVYTSEGLRKLDQWKAVWALQDREEAGEKGLKIPEPPEFGKEDFAQARYLQIRGRLNVPRERFILFADLSPPRYGWNGWRDLDRAKAQVDAYVSAESHPTDPLPRPTAEDPRRCGATVGLWESLPDVKRWGDHQTRDADHGEIRGLAEGACEKKSCPCEVVKEWQLWKDGKRGLGPAGEAPTAPAAATVEERAQVVNVLDKLGDAGATMADLARTWQGAEPRLALVLDDLIASGDVFAKGRGKARRYRAKPPPDPQQNLLALGPSRAPKKKKKSSDADP